MVSGRLKRDRLLKPTGLAALVDAQDSVQNPTPDNFQNDM
jgi:hypothetical protein